MDAARRYEETQGRVRALVGGLADGAGRTPVAACPGWSVHDVVSHLAGVAADMTSGRLEGAGGPAWTAAQVEERRDRTLAEVVEEWDAGTAALLALMVDGPPARSAVLVADAVTHEHDLRAALGAPGERDSAAVDVARQVGIEGLDRRLRAAELAALRVVAGDTEWLLGVGEPAATLRSDPFSLFRVLFGRRSRAQMAALDWGGDPGPYLEHLSLFPPPDADLAE